MSNPPPQIDYAQHLPWHRERRWQRAIIAATLLILGTVGGILWGPSIWRQAQLLYWQRKCLTSAHGEDTIVYDTATKAGVTSTAWMNFYRAYSPPGLISKGTIFVGGMKSLSGDEYLVGVDIITADPERFSIKTRAFIPGRLLAPPVERQGAHASWEGKPAAYRVLGGAIDRQDPSHLTFLMITDLGERTFDVWLTDHQVIVERRRLTEPPPASPE